MKKRIIFTILAVFFIFNQNIFVFAQQGAPEIPQTIEEAQVVGKKVLEGLPGVFKEALGGMLNWLKDLWESYFFPFLRKIWQITINFLRKEVEERKPDIQEEFKKEKQELKEELPEATKSLWQKFKELIK